MAIEYGILLEPDHYLTWVELAYALDLITVRREETKEDLVVFRDVLKILGEVTSGPSKVAEALLTHDIPLTLEGIERRINDR